jgi:predicted RNA-binding protein with PIN domain
MSTARSGRSREVAEPVTLVDAENVRRSQWPNLGKEELVELVIGWAEATGSPVLVVFDGSAPTSEAGPTVKVVGTSGESADDRIARDAQNLARAGRPYRLVTSDRGLRARAGGAADDVVGGGTFVRTLRALARA